MVFSSYGFDKEEFDLINKDSKLEYVSSLRTIDVNIKDTNLILNVESMPESWVKYELIEGKFPSSSGEIAIEKIKNNNYKIGDKISLVKRGAFSSLRLKIEEFTICGFISSPQSILAEGSASSIISNSKIDGYGLIIDDDFNISYDNLLKLKYKDTEDLSYFSTDYKAINDSRSLNFLEESEKLKAVKKTKVEKNLKDLSSNLEKEIVRLDKKLKSDKESLKTNQDNLKNEKTNYDKKEKAFKDKLNKAYELEKNGKKRA